MKFRIVERTHLNGCKEFIIQKKHWFLWMKCYSGSFPSLEHAKTFLCAVEEMPFVDKVVYEKDFSNNS